MTTPTTKSTAPPSTMTVTILIALAMVTFPIAGAVSTLVTDDPTWVPTAKLTPESLGTQGYGSNVAMGNNILLVATDDPDQVHVYEHGDQPNGWEHTQTLTPPASAEKTSFGASLALEDGTAVIADHRQETVYVYEHTPTDGFQLAHTLTSDDQDDGFGESVDIDEARIAIGAPNTDVDAHDNAGAIHVYTKAPNGLTHELVTRENTESSDRLGSAVAISHDTLAALSISNGNAHVFEKTSNGWEQTVEGIADTGHARTIALDQDTLAIGHPTQRTIVPVWYGAVTIYQDTDDGWTHAQTLYPEDIAPLEERVMFGMDLDIHDGGALIAVGAPEEDTTPGLENPLPPERDTVCWRVPTQPTCAPTGATYLYAPTQDGWSQTSKLTPLDQPTASQSIGSTQPHFGAALSISPAGDNILVGAPNADGVPTDDAGAAYLFDHITQEVAS